MKLKKGNRLLLIVTIFFTIFAFAGATGDLTEQLEQLKDILDSSSTYSDFQTRMLLNAAQNVLKTGISFDDTKGIMANSVEKSLDAYSLKKVFDLILDTQQDGLPAEPLIHKINEGLAKNIDKTILISVISTKAEKLKVANEILNEARQEGLEIDGGEQIIEILADSLENNVPQESLSWLLKMGTEGGKSIKEITEISEELSHLSLMAYDAGLTTEEISLLFKKAMDSSSDITAICENIQEVLESEISTAKPEGDGKPITSTSGTLSPSLESTVEMGETPTQEAGEAPTETGGTPEPETSPEEETPSPPEN